jgi:hypothetical protein
MLFDHCLGLDYDQGLLPVIPDSPDHNPKPPVSILNLGASNSPSQDHQLLTQGEKLQRQFGSAHNQTTNKDEDDVAERHLASVHEVFFCRRNSRQQSIATQLPFPKPQYRFDVAPVDI